MILFILYIEWYKWNNFIYPIGLSRPFLFSAYNGDIPTINSSIVFSVITRLPKYFFLMYSILAGEHFFAFRKWHNLTPSDLQVLCYPIFPRVYLITRLIAISIDASFNHTQYHILRPSLVLHFLYVPIPILPIFGS